MRPDGLLLQLENRPTGPTITNLGNSNNNLALAAFCPHSVNVLNFDPEYGADKVNAYVTKYVIKSETYDFMEVPRSSPGGPRVLEAKGRRCAFEELILFHHN